MITVVVADDSALVRRLISGVLNDTPDIRVVGTAHHGEQAITKIGELKPDLLTLDIEMPVMDGLTAMREIHRRYPTLPVLMVSTLTERGAAITLDALAAGARDYVTKPSNTASLAGSLEELRGQLIPRIRALAGRRRPAPPVAAPAPPRPAKPTGGVRPARIVAIGSSTGGPDALARILGSIPTRPTVPIVAVQHMPPLFTAMLAQRLSRIGPVDVVEASHGQMLEPGVMYLAPGGRHLQLRREGAAVVTALSDGAPENYSRPSVDVLFRSVAATYPGAAIGVVLTGMGHDGRAGCGQLAAGGSPIVAQDQASSVVWGMPGAVAEAGLADAIISIDAIGPYLTEQLRAPGAGRRIAAGAAP